MIGRNGFLFESLDFGRVAVFLLGLIAGVPAMGLASPMTWEDDVRQSQAEGRWSDVARLYQEQLGREPGRGDLWVKLADIEVARGNTNAVMPALEMAVKALPGDAGLHARLSQQYAMANQPAKALQEIDRAVQGAPDNTDYLKARAQIANWLGKYKIAGDSYERLLKLSAQGPDYGLLLARSRTWQGDLDGAARAYKRYVESHDGEADVLLEYARVQGWRGDYSRALHLLDQYEKRFPGLPKPDGDRSRFLAWANKPHAATGINDELLVRKPDDYELNVTRTVALNIGNQKKEAVDSLGKLETLRPQSEEVVAIKRYVDTPLRPEVSLFGRFYNDEDNLSMWQESARAGYSVNPGTRLGALAEFWQLKADRGSGLENRDGTRTADYQKAMLQFQQTLLPSLWINAAAGAAEVDGTGSLFVYDVLAGARPWDSLLVSLEQSRDSVLISPRSASLGIRRDTTQVQAEWTPGFDYTVAAQGRFDRFSDGNDRWEGVLSPRRSVIRSNAMNLDLGVRALLFGFSEDLNSGYYDPGLYQQYALTAFSYWKLTPECGLSLIGAAGYYKDDTMNNFDFGWSGDTELTLGAHRDWMTKIGGHYMQNFRPSGGAYHAVAVDISLTRRF